MRQLMLGRRAMPPISTMTLTVPAAAARAMTCWGVRSPAWAPGRVIAATKAHVDNRASAMNRLRMREVAQGGASGLGNTQCDSTTTPWLAAASPQHRYVHD